MIFHSPYPDVAIPDKPLTHFLLEQIQPYGDKPALIDGPTGRTLTYAQLAGAIRLVASGLPSDPPRFRGFPVTTAGSASPRILLTVSLNHAMMRESVSMSGAGMSVREPMMGMISTA